VAQKLKPELLDGIKYTETVELEHNGQTYEVDIRPLRHSEVAAVQSLISSALKVDMKGIGKKVARENVSFDVGEIVKGRYAAWLKAAALGTVDDVWTEEMIDQKWPPEWVQKVGAQVMKISGISEPQEIDSFRENE